MRRFGQSIEQQGPARIASKVFVIIVFRSGSSQVEGEGEAWKEQQLYVASDDPRVSLFFLWLPTTDCQARRGEE